MQAATTPKFVDQRPTMGILAAAALAAGLAIGAIAGVTVKSVAAPASATVTYSVNPDAKDSSVKATSGGLSLGAIDELRNGGYKTQTLGGDFAHGATHSAAR